MARWQQEKEQKPEKEEQGVVGRRFASEACWEEFVEAVRWF